MFALWHGSKGLILLQFAEGVILDLDVMLQESVPGTPMICFLSMGSDPTDNIERLAKTKNTSKYTKEHQ